MFSDLHDIWGESGDGMDAGGRVETGGGRAVYGADGRVADSTGDSHAEGVAPITTELRAACGSANGMLSYAVIDLHDFDRCCDAIDAVHAQLERDYKVACEVNERQDELYADVVHKLDRAYEKNRNQRKQLTEVQEALHRRNEGELKARWQKEIDRLERENEELRRQLESLMLDSRPMTVEDVLREFAQEMNENLGMYTGEAIEADEWRDADAKTVAKYAAKIRLVGDDE